MEYINLFQKNKSKIAAISFAKRVTLLFWIILIMVMTIGNIVEHYSKQISLSNQEMVQEKEKLLTSIVATETELKNISTEPLLKEINELIQFKSQLISSDNSASSQSVQQKSLFFSSLANISKNNKLQITNLSLEQEFFLIEGKAHSKEDVLNAIAELKQYTFFKNKNISSIEINNSEQYVSFSFGNTNKEAIK